jgi:tRNA-dihydrouridine synthase B
MDIGPYTFDNPLILAPMAGVTDRAFRRLCYQLGASLCVSEMVTSEKHLWNSRKTRRRLNHDGEAGIRCVQIAGTDPVKMADAARFNVDLGAQIIDINMGCPAKKVCNVMAGSALMRDESRVAEILQAVVNAVPVPVTLKTRTGWDIEHRNALNIAHIAEQSGIAALAVHGRTRADKFRGHAEFETIAEIKARVNIPVIANGDIDGPEKALQVLNLTQADGLMIGRAAQGNPWIFRQIRQALDNRDWRKPDADEITRVLIQHLEELYSLYGEISGVRIARKHIGWYIKQQCLDSIEAEAFRNSINMVDDCRQQVALVSDFFNTKHNQKAA